MRAGEVAFPHDSSLGWIGHITSDVFWPRLVALRIKALSLELPRLSGLIANAMANIDGIRTAQVIRDQITETPAGWREFQEARAAEYEREARLRQVQATPFERIIQRLRLTTTLGMFKVWCEGLTDGPTIDALLAQLTGATELGIVTDSLGGWNNILSPQWRPDRLRDGCHDLIVLVDGDKGRDHTTVGLYPDFPKSTNTLYLYILRAKLSVRPAQVDGIYVNIMAISGFPKEHKYPISLYFTG